ncbi:MAG TPA: hypothetical protein VLB68_12240 [Pyrinomonadaceae bacterium]|nr:hypothetical protein [Pyrinomonadaceae bacterium]
MRISSEKPKIKPLHSTLLLVLLGLFLTPVDSNAQKSTPKLPSVSKIIDQYIKASGGKKNLASITDADYQWSVELKGEKVGTATSLRKSPASERWEIALANEKIILATNSSSAWESKNDQTRTLSGTEAATAKLKATLDGSRFLNFKKSNVLGRVLSIAGDSYVVEFSTRGGARLRYYFAVAGGLITKISNEANHTYFIFDDYRSERRVLEPHRIRLSLNNVDEFSLTLDHVNYNSGLAQSLFDPPRALDTLDVVSLLREVGKNQDEVEKHVSEYSYRQKETDREINDKGELKKETVKLYEVYPLPNREAVQKLISENGVPLSAERAAKEDKRVQQELTEAERDHEKDEQAEARRKAEREKKNRSAGRDEAEDPEISQFLKACEFVSPRKERLADRETIVFDFRPRPGFKSSSRSESLISKLIGVVWIDPVDKQVVRLEARLAEGFKMAGGLLVSLKPGAAMVMEQTRMTDGVWLPRFAQINLSVKVLLFGGGDYNKTVEWSDYKHFSGEVKDYKIEVKRP